MTVSRIGALRVAEDFGAALLWMSDLGIRTDKVRVQTYSDAIARWAEMRPMGDEFTRHVLSPSDRSAIFEATQFTDIFLAFKSTPKSALTGIIDKLSRVISGPPNVADETHDTSAPRNFLFEAVVAAKMQIPEQSCHAMLNAPSDTGAAFRLRRIAVECKRLRSVSQLEKRVRDACNQLDVKLNGGPPCFDYGLVALEVSNIVSMNESSEGEFALRTHSMATMDEFINTHSRTWQKVYPEKNRRILGSLIRISKFIQSETDGLWVIATEWAVNPRHRLGSCQTRLLKRFAAALQAGANSY